MHFRWLGLVVSGLENEQVIHRMAQNGHVLTDAKPSLTSLYIRFLKSEDLLNWVLTKESCKAVLYFSHNLSMMVIYICYLLVLILSIK